MCCEECPKYDRCADDDRLKDNCCPKCPEYYDCAAMDDRDRGSSRDSDYDNYSWH